MTQVGLPSPRCYRSEFWLIFKHSRHRSFITVAETNPATPAVNAAHIGLCSAPLAIASRNAMRQILVFAVVMIALAAAAPKLLRPVGTSPTTTAQATAERSDPSYPRTASIPAAPTGTSRPTPMSTGGGWDS